MEWYPTLYYIIPISKRDMIYGFHIMSMTYATSIGSRIKTTDSYFVMLRDFSFGIRNSKGTIFLTIWYHIYFYFTSTTTLVVLRLEGLQLWKQYWKCGIAEYSKHISYFAYFFGFMYNSLL
jgi:hypothetical protein